MKDKAYRLAQKERVVKKRLKLVRRLDHGHVFSDGKTDYEHQLESANKLAKKHPFDCGKADCLMCHGPKIHKKWDPKKNKYKTSMLEDYNEF